MAEAFYRKWRSQTFGELVGQEHVTRTLLGALATGRLSHAYLFCGPRGTGKTSTARILAKAVNCLTHEGRADPCNTCAMCRAIADGRAIDLIEMDAASNRGIDDVRELRDRVAFAPNEARYKVYIIDEVHQLTQAAFDALLKTLEEPPRHVIFILATTEAHKVPPTILSRCQRFDFRRIPTGLAGDRLRQIADREGIAIEPDAIQMIVRSAGGSLRDAENLLDQVAAFYGDRIDTAHVRETLGIPDSELVRRLIREIVDRDLTGGLHTINEVADRGEDLRHFGRQLLGYLRTILLIKADADRWADLPAAEMDELRALAGRVSLADVTRITRSFSFSERKQEDTTSLPFELALVEVIAASPAAAAPPQARGAFDGREAGSAPPTRFPAAPSAPAGDRSSRPAPADRVPDDPDRRPIDIRTAARDAVLQIVPSPADPQPPPVPDTTGISATNPPPATDQPVDDVDDDTTPPSHPPPSVGGGRGGAATAPPASDTTPPPLSPPSVGGAPGGASATAPPSAAVFGDDLERLRLGWRSLVDQFKRGDPRYRKVQALLRDTCQVVDVRDGQVVLAFRHALYKEKLEEPDSRRIAEEAISAWLGAPYRIVCTLETDQPPPDKLSTARDDPLVQAAIRHGARLRDVT